MVKRWDGGRGWGGGIRQGEEKRHAQGDRPLVVHGLVEAEGEGVAGLESQRLGAAARGAADVASHVVGIQI